MGNQLMKNFPIFLQKILPEVGEWKNERKANEADKLNCDANEKGKSRRKKQLDNLKAFLIYYLYFKLKKVEKTYDSECITNNS